MQHADVHSTPALFLPLLSLSSSRLECTPFHVPHHLFPPFLKPLHKLPGNGLHCLAMALFAVVSDELCVCGNTIAPRLWVVVEPACKTMHHATANQSRLGQGEERPRQSKKLFQLISPTIRPFFQLCRSPPKQNKSTTYAGNASG